MAAQGPAIWFWVDGGAAPAAGQVHRLLTLGVGFILPLLAMLLIAAGPPPPSATLVLQDTTPVTVLVTLDKEPNGRHSSYGIGGGLQCSNGYRGFDRLDDTDDLPFVFDGTETVIHTPGLVPGGTCTLTVRFGTVWQRVATYTDLGEITFDV